MSISQGIAMAAIPIGAGLGAFKSNIIIEKFSRRYFSLYKLDKACFWSTALPSFQQ
jgi:hypothetical protein